MSRSDLVTYCLAWSLVCYAGAGLALGLMNAYVALVIIVANVVFIVILHRRAV